MSNYVMQLTVMSRIIETQPATAVNEDSENQRPVEYETVRTRSLLSFYNSGLCHVCYI
jgi:hypothetical protein